MGCESEAIYCQPWKWNLAWEMERELWSHQSTVGQNSQQYRLKYWATHSSVRSFVRTTHLFACSRALLARSLTLLTPSLMGKWTSRWLYILCFLFYSGPLCKEELHYGYGKDRRLGYWNYREYCRKYWNNGIWPNWEVLLETTESLIPNDSYYALTLAMKCKLDTHVALTQLCFQVWFSSDHFIFFLYGTTLWHTFLFSLYFLKWLSYRDEPGLKWKIIHYCW